MRIAEFPVIGTLDTTLPSPGDDTYQAESLCLTIHKIIKELSDNDFEFQQAVTSDVSTFVSDLQSGVDNNMTRYEEILQQGFSEVVGNIPDVLPIMAAVMSGGGSGVIAALLQGVLDTIIRHKDIRTDEADGDPIKQTPENSADIVTELEAITIKLEDLRVQLSATLNSFNINMYDDHGESTWSVGPVPE